MGKRFTETTKWSDPWFRKLGPAEKCAWGWMLDNCDLAGVIDIDRDLAEFQIGAEVDWDGMIDDSDGRLVRLDSGKVWIAKFVAFQNKKLDPNSNSNAVQAVIEALHKHSLWQDYLKGTQKGPCRDQGKGKGKGKGTEGGVGGDRFGEFWEHVPKKVAKGDAKKAYAAAVKRIGSDDTHPAHKAPQEFLCERMAAFAESDKAKGQFCPNPATWLNGGRYDDDPEAWQERGRGSPATGQARVMQGMEDYMAVKRSQQQQPQLALEHHGE